MEPVAQRVESGADRYRRQIRDLLVCVLDYGRILANPPPTQNTSLRGDVILAAEHLSETRLSASAPPEAEARPIWGAIADDILACLEEGRMDRLKPTVWAVRVGHDWWYGMGWLGRLVSPVGRKGAHEGLGVPAPGDGQPGQGVTAMGSSRQTTMPG